MNIKWYGHSCFQLKTKGGVRIVTDPYDNTVGYPMHQLCPDILTISHDHYDHNGMEMIQNAPRTIREAGVFEEKGVRITGIASYHDDKEGALRGNNLIFLFEMDGLRVAHMGDIGAMPPEEVLAVLTPLDVLLVPIGGTYTIGPRLACDLANVTNARVFIPMHYQTQVLTLGAPLFHVKELVSVARGCSIHRLNQSECSISPDSLGDDRILILDYER